MDNETKELLRQTKLAWKRGYKAGKISVIPWFLFQTVIALAILFTK